MDGQWIEIFRAGTHTDANGRTSAWTEADLARIVAAYDPAAHEAPVVLGHPATDSPAYGWVEALKRSGRVLLARFRQVAPEFADWVRRGLYKKRSIALYGDGTLRHVGFLGGTPPAVKGLADVAFADGGREVSAWEFADASTGRLLRRLREWLLAKFGAEAADQVAPEWEIGELEGRLEAGAPESDGLAPAGFGLAEGTRTDRPEKEEFDMTEEKNKLAAEALQAQLDALAKERSEAEARFSENQRKLAEENDLLKARLRRGEVEAKLDALARAGKVTPALLKLGLAEFVSRLDGTVAVEFAEGIKEPPAAFMLRLLDALPALPLFAEQATAERAGGETGGSPEEIAREAARYHADEAAAGRSVSYTEAVAAVMRKKIRK